jgi:hypothetical protein
MKRRYISQVITIGCLAASCGNSANAVLVRTVAVTGQPAPGVPAGTVFRSFTSEPSLNNLGRTAFHAWITGGGVSDQNDTGIWSDGLGQLELVAREGSGAPGTQGGATFHSFFGRLPLSDAGGISFFAEAVLATGPAVPIPSFWSRAAGDLRMVARLHDRAPGTSGNIRFNYLSHHVGAERVGFYGGLGNTVDVNNSGIWSDISGSLELVVLQGEQGPGAPPGYTFDYFDLFSLVVNDVDDLVFRGRTHGSGVLGYRYGIWRATADGLELLALQGDQAPGLAGGVTFVDFDTIPPSVNALGLNNARQIAFSSTIAGTEVDSTNDMGVWAGEPSDLRLVAREGSAAPGTGGAAFNYDLHGVVLNSKGQTAFQAFLTGHGVDSTNNVGVWSEGTGDLELVARSGSHAPGTPVGVVFRDFGSFSFETLVLNAQGQVAFPATLTGDGVDISNNRGIWATDPGGQLQLIARAGDTLQIAPGDSRTIRSLGFVAGSGNEDGRPSGFNDFGELAFSAQFTDGSSGIFISNLIAVPEPATLLDFSCALWFAMGTRFRFRRDVHSLEDMATRHNIEVAIKHS